MIKKRKKAKKGAFDKIRAVDGKPLNEKQIQFFISHYNKNGNLPGHAITCSVTGKLSVCVGPWLKKKVKQFGSIETFLRGYKCREALKAEKVNIFVVKKKSRQKKSKKEHNIIVVPKMPTGTRRPESDEEFRETSKMVCARPDIYLNNGRHCLDCPFYAICENSLKTLPKGTIFDGEDFIEKKRAA